MIVIAGNKNGVFTRHAELLGTGGGNKDPQVVCGRSLWMEMATMCLYHSQYRVGERKEEDQEVCVYRGRGER